MGDQGYFSKGALLDAIRLASRARVLESSIIMADYSWDLHVFLSNPLPTNTIWGISKLPAATTARAGFFFLLACHDQIERITAHKIWTKSLRWHRSGGIPFTANGWLTHINQRKWPYFERPKNSLDLQGQATLLRPRYVQVVRLQHPLWYCVFDV